ncbi:hypothetical protein QAD02_008851 [Eretmocerus hayati]|uniref:Uncharacterized protein n=1 Tax=Eretmocerus hayati TaxID=131215 RepID=A0ACC2NA31_9HYME|nr:hypothetical protein QAD02_008851 [Eretmocerus hayati]
MDIFHHILIICATQGYLLGKVAPIVTPRNITDPKDVTDGPLELDLAVEISIEISTPNCTKRARHSKPLPCANATSNYHVTECDNIQGLSSDIPKTAVPKMEQSVNVTPSYPLIKVESVPRSGTTISASSLDTGLKSNDNTGPNGNSNQESNVVTLSNINGGASPAHTLTQDPLFQMYRVTEGYSEKNMEIETISNTLGDIFETYSSTVRTDDTMRTEPLNLTDMILNSSSEVPRSGIEHEDSQFDLGNPTDRSLNNPNPTSATIVTDSGNIHDATKSTFDFAEKPTKNDDETTSLDQNKENGISTTASTPWDSTTREPTPNFPQEITTNKGTEVWTITGNSSPHPGALETTTLPSTMLSQQTQTTPLQSITPSSTQVFTSVPMARDVTRPRFNRKSIKNQITSQKVETTTISARNRPSKIFFRRKTSSPSPVPIATRKTRPHLYQKPTINPQTSSKTETTAMSTVTQSIPAFSDEKIHPLTSKPTFRNAKKPQSTQRPTFNQQTTLIFDTTRTSSNTESSEIFSTETTNPSTSTIVTSTTKEPHLFGKSTTNDNIIPRFETTTGSVETQSFPITSTERTETDATKSKPTGKSTTDQQTILESETTTTSSNIRSSDASSAAKVSPSSSTLITNGITRPLQTEKSMTNDINPNFETTTVGVDSQSPLISPIGRTNSPSSETDATIFKPTGKSTTDQQTILESETTTTSSNTRSSDASSAAKVSPTLSTVTTNSITKPFPTEKSMTSDRTDPKFETTTGSVDSQSPLISPTERANSPSSEVDATKFKPTKKPATDQENRPKIRIVMNRANSRSPIIKKINSPTTVAIASYATIPYTGQELTTNQYTIPKFDTTTTTNAESQSSTVFSTEEDIAPLTEIPTNDASKVDSNKTPAVNLEPLSGFLEEGSTNLPVPTQEQIHGRSSKTTSNPSETTISMKPTPTNRPNDLTPQEISSARMNPSIELQSTTEQASGIIVDENSSTLSELPITTPMEISPTPKPKKTLRSTTRATHVTQAHAEIPRSNRQSGEQSGRRLPDQSESNPPFSFPPVVNQNSELFVDSQGCIGYCDDSDPYLPNTDCRKFCRCAYGSTFLFKCPATLYYDPELNICNWPKRENYYTYCIGSEWHSETSSSGFGLDPRLQHNRKSRSSVSRKLSVPKKKELPDKG